MKKLATALIVTSVFAVTGCTTVKEIFGTDKTGTHDVHSKINNKAPVTSMNGILVDADKRMTLYTYDKDSYNKSDCKAVCLAA